MATAIVNQTISEFKSIIPNILRIPNHKFWLDYDNEADVLYINFKKPQRATDSEMLESGILVRYRDEELVGVTILDASLREGM